jgi:hypothetical protein
MFLRWISSSIKMENGTASRTMVPEPDFSLPSISSILGLAEAAEVHSDGHQRALFSLR